MPHIILEHNLDEPDRVHHICKKLHGCLARQETVKLDTIKTRSLLVSNVVVGDGTLNRDFAHVNLKLLPGRSEELKLAISQNLLSVLSSILKEGACSVEVSELHAYSK